MSMYPTKDGFKDERQEAEEDNMMDDLEFYDEPVDNSVWGWVDDGNICPNCGHGMLTRSQEYNDVFEVENVCTNCEYYEVHYD
jgi:hypothetical protein